jgi:hypothetical protein
MLTASEDKKSTFTIYLPWHLSTAELIQMKEVNETDLFFFYFITMSSNGVGLSVDNGKKSLKTVL